MMKTLLRTVIMLIIFSNSVKAQNTPDKPHLSQPELNRFNGKWQYVSGDTAFSIQLRTVKTFVNTSGGIYVDLIKGDYKVVVSNKVLQSTRDCQGISSGSFVDKVTNKFKIHFLFYDKGKNSKSGDVIFEMDPNDPNKASWQLTNTEGVRMGKYDYSFSVPTKALFRKVR